MPLNKYYQYPQREIKTYIYRYQYRQRVLNQNYPLRITYLNSRSQTYCNSIRVPIPQIKLASPCQDLYPSQPSLFFDVDKFVCPHLRVDKFSDTYRSYPRVAQVTDISKNLLFGR